MNKLIRFSAFIILTFGIIACDEVKDAINEITEINFNTTLTDSFAVTIESGNEMNVSQSVSISIDNDDTHDYLSKIESVSINSLTYKIISHSGDDTANAAVDFFADQTVLMSHNIVIKEAFDNGTIFQVTDVDYLNEIATKLENGSSVLMGMSGVSNSEGATNFTVEVTIDVKVTANAT